jgi:hypothetical protein
MAYKIRKTKHFIRKRLESPKKFDPRSFRTVRPRKDIRVVVGCPRGKFKEGRCRVGLRGQAILKRR